jgi:hypothetical protein
MRQFLPAPALAVGTASASVVSLILSARDSTVRDKYGPAPALFPSEMPGRRRRLASIRGGWSPTETEGWLIRVFTSSHFPNFS